ncbi:MAG: SDR family NAD(P)-dependent oxidoreductase [Gemmatimonadetes bacterium]|nr:SDR family NAD(P)-dependent oxidoreductase [Gemmatimonadota bacterium]
MRSATLIAIVLSTAAAYAIGRFDFRYRNVLDAATFLPLMIPQIILGLALLLFLKNFGLVGNLWGLSLALAREGWAVGLAARTEGALREVEAEIRGQGGIAAALPCDVSSRAAVHRAVDACRRTLGPVDLLVANAGISENTRPEGLDAEGVERMLRVNFLGAVYAVEAVLPEMLARGSGHLVAVSSLAGHGGLPLTAGYSASKAAMTAFFESLRLDLRARGVAVTVVTPGYVRTPMTERNAHGMAFLVEPDVAVRRMMKGIRRRARNVAFPLPLALLTRVARAFPRGLYDALASRARREKRE